MKKKFISILCTAAIATSLFTGATVVSAAENKEAKDITIGVSFGQNVHPFFVAMQKGIEQAVQILGLKTAIFLQQTVLWKHKFHRLKIWLPRDVMSFF